MIPSKRKTVPALFLLKTFTQVKAVLARPKEMDQRHYLSTRSVCLGPRRVDLRDISTHNSCAFDCKDSQIEPFV